MVMEFIEGTTLLRRIKKEGRIPESEALALAVQVARALDHAARRGIIHRDVKPDNIFIDERGQAKLGDWGLAKDMEQDLGLTDTGTAIGTPYYMSPEQARGRRDLDVRADLYSLGATVFHAVCGQPPFRGNSPAEVIVKHLSSPVPDPLALAPELCPETAAVLRKLLEKSPAERYPDGESAAQAFEKALAASQSLVLT
jgi:serine/threonine-protein kinase